MKELIRISLFVLLLFMPAVNSILAEEEDGSPGYFEEVVVTAGRTPLLLKDLPANVSIVTSREIEESGAFNAAEALDKVAGLNVGDKGTLGNERTIRLRSGGSSSGQTLVMIDGMPVNNVSLGFSDLSAIPASKIERIEIIKGAGSSLYGANALGGVINIITKEAGEKDSKVNVKTGFGSFTTGNYSASYNYSAGDFNLFADIGRDYSAGWRLNNDYTNTSLMLKPSYSLGEKGKIGAKVYYFNDSLGVPGTNTTNIADYDGVIERAASSLDARQTDSNLYSQLSYENTLKNDSTIKASVYNRLETRNYVSPSWGTDTLSETVASGMDIQANISDDTVMGGDFKWDIFRRTDQATNTPEINKGLINVSLFLQKTFEYNRLNATIGLRDDYHSIFGNQLNPSVLLEYELSEALELSGNMGRAFRAPTFEDLYSPFVSWLASAYGPAGNTQGNSGILPETAWSGDIGLKCFIKDSLLCKFSAYYSSINNLIQWSDVSSDPALQEYRPQNIGLAYNLGIEVELKYIVAERLTHRLNYILLDSRGKGEFDTDFVLMNYSPAHRLNYNIGLSLESGTRMMANAKYVSSQWSASGGSSGFGTELPAYFLLNFRITQKISVYEVFVAINNILDTYYKTRNEFPLPGRYFSAGISLRI